MNVVHPVRKGTGANAVTLVVLAVRGSKAAKVNQEWMVCPVRKGHPDLLVHLDYPKITM